MVPLHDIFERLEQAIEVENQSRQSDGLEPGELIGPTEIWVLGQMSLLTNAKVTAKIRVVATRDVDAMVTGGPYSWVAKKFSELLEASGLELDRYADEIWLPEGATYEEVFTGQYLTCHRLNPLDALVSKAVKAPAKNRILIRQALAVYPELRSRIEESGGELTQFEDES